MAVAKYKIDTTVKVESDVVFDHRSHQFNKLAEHNEFFVRMQENFYNDLLLVKRFVFLNEILNALGLPQTAGGAVIGWTRGSHVDLKVLESQYRGTVHSGLVIRHNAQDNVLEYLESN